MSEAFNSVNFEILLETMQAYGIFGKVIKWLKFYVIGRSQSVEINGYVSFIFKCLSGVSQGSHVGSLFYIIHANYLKRYPKYFNVLVFADETKICKE